MFTLKKIKGTISVLCTLVSMLPHSYQQHNRTELQPNIVFKPQASHAFLLLNIKIF